MTPSDHKFELTSRTIDFGDRVLAVPQITHAASRKGRPFKALGGIGIAVALAGLGYEAVLGAGLSALKSGGSTRIWAIFVLAGLGIFGLIYQRRALVIALADGSKIRLASGSSDFQQQVVGCIGEALRAPGPYHVTVDLQAETITGGSASGGSASERQAAPGDAPSLPAQNGPMQNGVQTTAPRMQPSQQATQPHGSPQHGRMPGGPYRNGQQAPLDSLEARLNTAGPVQRTGPPVNGPIEMARSGEAQSWQGSTTPSRPAREPANPIRDLEALSHFVRQSDIQHKAALLDLLVVVDDYLKGGGTLREDAVAHWQSFSGYVHQYLAGVDGLVPLTDRAGRPFAVH